MKPNHTYLLPLIAFLIVISPSLVQHGMFFDGLTYSSISRNLAVGDGDVFHLYYTKSHSAVFYDHPPLFFLVQSAFFMLFGDHWWTEKLFCALMVLMNAFLMVKITASFQQHFSGKKKSSWPVVFLWLLVPITFWVYKNNVLEILLSTFTLAAAWCFVKLLPVGNKNTNPGFIFLFSFFTCCAFLTKGMTGLFPLVVPLVFFAVYFKNPFFTTKHLLMFYGIVFVFLFLFFLSLFSIPDFRGYMGHYFSEQLLRSISGERETADFRFKILTDLLFNFTFPVFYSVLVILIFRGWKKISSFRLSKPVVFFLLTGLSASLPILISPKQREMYLAPSIPYFVIAVYFYFAEGWTTVNEKLNGKNFIWGIRILTVIALVYNLVLAGRISRDEPIISFISENEKNLQQKTICVPGEIISNWKMHAYFMRYTRSVLINEKTEHCDKNISGDENRMFWLNEP